VRTADWTCETDSPFRKGEVLFLLLHRSFIQQLKIGDDYSDPDGVIL